MRPSTDRCSIRRSTAARATPQNDKSPALTGLFSIAGARCVAGGDGVRIAMIARLPASRRPASAAA